MFKFFYMGFKMNIGVHKRKNFLKWANIFILVSSSKPYTKVVASIWSEKSSQQLGTLFYEKQKRVGKKKVYNEFRNRKMNKNVCGA